MFPCATKLHLHKNFTHVPTTQGFKLQTNTHRATSPKFFNILFSGRFDNVLTLLLIALVTHDIIIRAPVNFKPEKERSTSKENNYKRLASPTLRMMIMGLMALSLGLKISGC